MLYRVLADIVTLVHFSFIIFVVLGGLLAFRWPRVVWAHVPAFLWGAGISFMGWVCPLTYLENDLRAKGAEAGYASSFMEEYILPVIYPETLFGSFPRAGFVAIGAIVLLVNGLIYWRLWTHRRHVV